MKNLNHSRTLAARLPARIFHTRTKPLINTGALARWKDAHSIWELFQQFVESGRKPLKRLIGSSTTLHRAKAPVLMRTCWNASGRCSSCAAVLLAVAASALAEVRYVDVNSTNSTSPYTNWATAATNIQDAVDAAVAGDEIVVTNGIYATGGHATVDSTKNRVAADKPLSVRSVNGAQFSTIDGGNSVRCVYLTNSASLSGFTLTNGFAGGGAGVFCESATAVVSNCVIAGNAALCKGWTTVAGGGARGGTLNNCVLSDNNAYGSFCAGGIFPARGGGAAGCVLNNCTLIGNSVHGEDTRGLSADGGGAYASTLNNCTLSGNSAWDSGGGAAGCILNNCIVYFNTVLSGANNNYDSSCTLNYSCTMPQPTNGVGNITNAPQFVDQASGNLRLQSSSPCINAGSNSYVTNATDLDGNPRIAGVTVDMGAYEYQSPPQLTITLSGAYVILTWPTNVAGFDYKGFTLQSTTNLVSPSVWTTVFPGPVAIAGQNTVVSPISGSQQFYRLRRQTGGCRSNLDCPPGYRCIIPTGETVGTCSCYVSPCPDPGF